MRICADKEEADLSEGSRANPLPEGAGVGLGLRWPFADALLRERPRQISALEIAPENYLGRGGAAAAVLEQAKRAYPILVHGLSVGLAGTEPPSQTYLRRLRRFLEEVGASTYSDHLSFGQAGGRFAHELLPVPLTRHTVRRAVDRIRRLRDDLRVEIAVENISFYAHPDSPELPEPAFVAEIVEAADCALLFDVNNAYVNAENHDYALESWLQALPVERIVQVHVAGHDRWELDDGEAIVIDTHGAPPIDPVLELLRAVVERTGPVPVVLEWDNAIPAYEALVHEHARVRGAYERAIAARTA